MSSEFGKEHVGEFSANDNASKKTQMKFAYQKVYWHIKKKMRDGIYAQGALIPTESQLMEEYGVSRTTIRRAIAILAEEGMLNVIQGSGTSVTNAALFQRFEDVTHVQEITPTILDGAEIHADISVDEVFVSAEEAYVLEVNPGDAVYRVTRFCGYDGRFFLIKTNLIPKALAPDLPLHEKELSNIYPILNKYYDVHFAAAIEDVSVRGATQIEAQILGVERGSPVYYMVRTARSNKGPMERAYSVVHPDSYKLRMHMNTLPGDAILKLLEKES